VTNAGVDDVNQQYEDVTSGTADELPEFVGKTHSNYGIKHGENGWFIVGPPGKLASPMYHTVEKGENTLYEEYQVGSNHARFC
jgi:hypothetical protein